MPHLIDADSGVGTQVIAKDINGDGLPEIVVGNKKGTYFHSHTARTVSEAEYNNAQPKRLVSAQNDHRTNLGLIHESTGPQEHSGLLPADAVKE